MNTMSFLAGMHVALWDVEEGDLVKLPSGKLAVRQESVGDKLISATYISGQTSYGDAVYTKELFPYDTECEFVLSSDQLHGILLRAQDVRDLIDTYLPTDKKMRYAFHE